MTKFLLLLTILICIIGGYYLYTQASTAQKKVETQSVNDAGADFLEEQIDRGMK